MTNALTQSYNFSVEEDECMINFKEMIQRAALELACEMCANMRSPRKEIYTIISAFEKTYISKIISGTYIRFYDINSMNEITHIFYLIY